MFVVVVIVVGIIGTAIPAITCRKIPSKMCSLAKEKTIIVFNYDDI